MNRSDRSSFAPAICAIVVALLGCAKPQPAAPMSTARTEGSEVEVGSLVQSQAQISLDVLIPADGDLPAALERARDVLKGSELRFIDSLPETAREAVAKVELVSVADEHWNHKLPGFVASKIDPEAFARVDAAAGVVRIDARAPADRAWALLRAVASAAHDVAAAQHGWIYDSYRAELHDAETFTGSIPDPHNRDVRAMTRVMGVVSTRGELDHVRTVGLWRLGLPELYLAGVPDDALDDAMSLMQATAQTLVQQDGVVRRGTIEINLSKLPYDWPRPAAGTGRFTWQARWMRGPIHHNAMVIVLSSPGARDNDPTVFVAALHRYTGR